MITYIKGDLFETHCDIIAHGCNAQGVMGAGVAKLIKNKYPTAFEKYKNEIINNKLDLGCVQFIKTNGKIIANCITQNNYNNNGVMVDYKAIEKCIKKLYSYAKENDISVAMPMIGSGLGGGDWHHIEDIIERTFIDYNVYVYYL